jgi:NAD(P)-dependent dehydrogenase (short-subunit alcohol dehydrogenase family)
LGLPVAVHYRNSDKEALEVCNLINSAGGQAAAVQCDLDDTEATKHLIQRASDALGSIKISCLVLNASRFEFDSLTSISEETFAKHMSSNTLAATLLTQSFVAQYNSTSDSGSQSNARQTSGDVSITQLLDYKLAAPNADHLSYTLSRYANAGLMEVFSRELAYKGIRVNAVSPGVTLQGNNSGSSIMSPCMAGHCSDKTLRVIEQPKSLL